MTLTLVVVFARGVQNVGYLWLVTYIFLKLRYVFQLKSAVQPCLERAGYTISAVFCLVRAVCEFYFRLVTNRTPNQQRPVVSNKRQFLIGYLLLYAGFACR
jgi:hypothetical protein